MGEPIGPFDGQHAVLHADFLEPEIVGRGAIEAVEIRVIERETSAAIFMDERESGTADVGGIDPEAFCEAAHKRRLACTEIAGEQQHVAGPERRGQLTRNRQCVFFRPGNSTINHERSTTNHQPYSIR